jgi:hypothetical protein
MFTRRDDEVGAAIGEEEVVAVVDVADVAEREVVAPVRRRGLVGDLCSTRSAGGGALM